MLGARAETSTRLKGAEGYETEGVRGLKALGVRDLTYRLAFLACSVSSSNPRVGIYKKYSKCNLLNVNNSESCSSKSLLKNILN